MPTPTKKQQLPDGASDLIALARVAHRNGDRQLEQSAVDRLTRDYGMRVSFPCCESVDRDLASAARPNPNAEARRHG